jgi:hypothetical protein
MRDKLFFEFCQRYRTSLSRSPSSQPLLENGAVLLILETIYEMLSGFKQFFPLLKGNHNICAVALWINHVKGGFKRFGDFHFILSIFIPFSKYDLLKTFGF